jgi:hypothetical protein
MGQLDPTLNHEVLYECLAILNSFIIDLPAATNSFAINKLELKKKLEQIMLANSTKVVDIVLRLSRNLLRREIFESLRIPKGVMSKVRDIDLVASLAHFVDS